MTRFSIPLFAVVFASSIVCGAPGDFPAASADQSSIEVQALDSIGLTLTDGQGKRCGFPTHPNTGRGGTEDLPQCFTSDNELDKPTLVATGREDALLKMPPLPLFLEIRAFRAGPFETLISGIAGDGSALDQTKIEATFDLRQCKVYRLQFTRNPGSRAITAQPFGDGQCNKDALYDLASAEEVPGAPVPPLR